MLELLSVAFGWLYFALWSFSWYPQIIDNWKRKSVVGLHLDYVSYNIVGHMSYSIFNAALFWIPAVQVQYLRDHPRGVIPVQLNDVIFSLHSFFCCSVVLLQCLTYERGGQRVSRLCRLLLAATLLMVLSVLYMGMTGILRWFDVLYMFSTIKLAVTIFKNVPQVMHNYERQSTLGWCIKSVITDFWGGVCSFLQMFTTAAARGDWGSMKGNPTKLGLGLLSMAFDMVFMMQHFVWYTEDKRKTLRMAKSMEIPPPEEKSNNKNCSDHPHAE